MGKSETPDCKKEENFEGANPVVFDDSEATDEEAGESADEEASLAAEAPTVNIPGAFFIN